MTVHVGYLASQHPLGLSYHNLSVRSDSFRLAMYSGGMNDISISQAISLALLYVVLYTSNSYPCQTMRP